MIASVEASKVIAGVLAAAGLYESAALGFRKFPTISEWVWRERKRRWLTPIMWGAWFWLTFHFFIEVH